jgi:hypothetical protein
MLQSLASRSKGFENIMVCSAERESEKSVWLLAQAGHKPALHEKKSRDIPALC